ncbi:MAG: AI-2E family transporter, partial [Caldilineae bacterium]
MNTAWDSATKRFAAVGLALLFLYVLYLSRPVLPLLVVATLIAFLLVPLVSFLQYKLRFPRWLAVLVAYLFLFLAVVLIPLLLIPALLDAFGAINIDLAALLRQVLIWLENTLQSWRSLVIFGIAYDFSSVVDPALEQLRNIQPARFFPSLDTLIASIPSTIQFTWGVASNVVGTLASSLLAFILTLLYSIYLSVDGGRFVQAIINVAPEPHRPELRELYRRIRATWSAYFRGQFLLALIIGFLTWLIGTAIGLPGAFALAVISGVLEILPNLGPILAAVPALLIALVQGSTTLPVGNFTFMLIVLGAYVLIQQLENNLIVPKILGDAVELHPLVVMVGVVVGATTFGILGALIAAPTIATGRTVIAYVYAKMLDEDPFPPTSRARPSRFPLTDGLLRLWKRLQDALPTNRQSAAPQKPEEKS